MATVEEISDWIWQHLGENSTFYPRAETVLNGINPAQRLLCLMRPDLLTVRATYSLVEGECFIDLRQAIPRAWQVTRVLIGDVTGDTPVRSNDELRDLTPTSLAQLSRKRDWIKHVGIMQSYWLFGRHWLGIYKRPTTTYTITLIYRAMPTAYDMIDALSDLASTPDLAASWHTAVAKVGAALLLIKEGAVEQQRAIGLLGEVFGEEPLSQVQKALERVQRQTARASA